MKFSFWHNGPIGSYVCSVFFCVIVYFSFCVFFSSEISHLETTSIRWIFAKVFREFPGFFEISPTSRGCNFATTGPFRMFRCLKWSYGSNSLISVVYGNPRPPYTTPIRDRKTIFPKMSMHHPTYKKFRAQTQVLAIFSRHLPACYQVSCQREPQANNQS